MKKRAVVVATALVLVTPTPAIAQQPGQCAPPELTVAQPEPWAQQRLAPERVWPMTKGAVRIAVVDTGVSAEAPTLVGAVEDGVDVAGGVANTDCAGHGTFLAGLIAARPREKTAFAGIAPAARVVPVRVTNDPNRVEPGALAAGIRAGVDSGARIVAIGVINTVDSPELQAAVELARSRDVLVVAPAAVRQAKQRAYPAAMDGVVAVAPVGPDGPTKSGQLGAQPTVAAPAEQLVGIGPSGTGHRLASGPELAVAFVAASAALVREQYPDLPAAEVVKRLMATADRPAGQVPHPAVGYGIVDPVAAVTTLLSGQTAKPSATREHLALALPPAEDTGPARAAMWFVAALAGAAVLAGGSAAVITRARRRRWRPAVR
ncbi:type VII secretion-associated serine protease mycosin [Actinokineospora baliensis]|uniref:S8 family serine peptidase n=1 Tax=Actinokineospora baliensis TaxID=547056 RepID=UPI0019595314|nr:S8 family serine peptidase [Actinokineospora baliensis]MBM7773649.1 type VII secretion-associated serine protease mycosin [Actinokineospora baliensis]